MVAAKFVVFALASLAAALGCTARDSPGAEQHAASCRADGSACEQAFAAWGLTPPRGTIDLPPRGGPELRLSATALAVDDEHVLTLAAGRPTDGGVVDHVAPALRDALERRAQAGRERAAREGTPWNASIAVLADRATPLSTLGDALFTATRAGFTAVELLVYDGARLRGLPLGVPFEWLPHEPGIKFKRRLEILFVVGVDAVEVRVGGGPPRRIASPSRCDPPPAGCHDLAAIAAFAAASRQEYPNEAVATFRVDGEVTLQAFVALVDAVRGADCRMAGPMAGEAVPDACLLWMSILDVAGIPGDR